MIIKIPMLKCQKSKKIYVVLEIICGLYQLQPLWASCPWYMAWYMLNTFFSQLNTLALTHHECSESSIICHI